MAKDNTPQKARKYRVAVTDALSHERLWSTVLTRPTLVTALVSGAVVLLLLLFLLIAFTPIRTFIPGYPDARARRQAVQNAMRIDSPETTRLRFSEYSSHWRIRVSSESMRIAFCTAWRRARASG